MRLSKVSIIAGIVGKLAYATTSVAILAKSVGKKAYDKLNFRSSYYITICAKETGLVIEDTTRKSTSEIVKILESMKDADIIITLERSKKYTY